MSQSTSSMKRIEELKKWISVLDNEINKADAVTMENDGNGVSETIWIDMSKLSSISISSKIGKQDLTLNQKL